MVIPVYDENPTRRRPYVTVALIVVNLAVFLLSPAARAPLLGHPDTALLCEQQAYFQKWGAVPDELVHDRQLPVTYGRQVGPDSCASVRPDYRKRPWLSAVTSIFVHGGWLHVLGNLLFLWVFGNNVEERFGRLRFLVFYLAVGMLASYGFALTRPSSTEALVGASGAISGVLGAYLVMFPRARVLGLVSFLFFLPVRLPAWIILGLWFVLQAVYAQGAGISGGEVAYLVHVLGFALGVVTAAVLGQRMRRPPRPQQAR